MTCHYCNQKAIYKCSLCPKTFCAICINDHLEAKMIPRRRWENSKIKLEQEEDENDGRGVQ